MNTVVPSAPPKQRLAGVSCPVDDIVPSPEVWGYRSKITPHFERPRDGEIGPIGFLRHGSRRRLVDVPSCPIASDRINTALANVRDDVRSRANTYKKGATLLLRDTGDRVLEVALETAIPAGDDTHQVVTIHDRHA